MEDMSFEQLMARYEMGQAYIAITEAMGPSPQLVAFINYDRAHEDNCGLESFDVMTQHTHILAEINADPAYDMALESFGGRVKSFLGKLKNLATLNKHAREIETFTKGTLGPRKSSVYVNNTAQYKTVMGAYAKNKALMERLIRIAPNSTDLKDWEAFGAKYIGLKTETELDKIEREVRNLQEETSKAVKLFSIMDFGKADWSASNFQAAAKGYVAIAKDIENTGEKLDTLMGKVKVESWSQSSFEQTSYTETKSEKEDSRTGEKKEVVERTPTYTKNTAAKQAVRAMNRLISVMQSSFNLHEDASDHAYRILKNVAQHFEAK